MNSSNWNEREVPWEAVAEYIEAGSIIGIDIRDDLATVLIDIGYMKQRKQGLYEASFRISCLNFSYLNISRLEHHTPGSGIIYETYLRQQSQLIEDVRTNRLDGKAGALVYQSESLNRAINHLEIVGEVNVNIICEEVRVTTNQFPPECVR